MTSEQVQWLNNNPQFRPVGRTGGKTHFEQCGLLHADGKFEDGVTVIEPPAHNSPNHAVVVGCLTGF